MKKMLFTPAISTVGGERTLALSLSLKVVGRLIIRGVFEIFENGMPCRVRPINSYYTGWGWGGERSTDRVPPPNFLKPLHLIHFFLIVSIFA